MTINDVMSNFYEMLVREKQGRTPITYKKKVDIFMEYLREWGD